MSVYGDPPLPLSGGRYPATDAELALCRRRILRWYLAAPAASLGAILLGVERDWPVAAAAGVIGLGVVALVIGVLAIVERRLVFIVRSWREARRLYLLYEGPAVVPLGIAYAVGGATLGIAAIAFLSGASLEVLRGQVLARPSLALVPIGVFLLTHGLGLAMGFGDRTAATGARISRALQDLPGRLGGLILIAWGALALALGGLDLIAPDAFDGLLAHFAGGHLPF